MTEYIAEYDGIRYATNCPDFKHSIDRGQSEPYPNQLWVVQKYLKEHPHKNRTYVDVGGHIGTTALPYSRMFGCVFAYEANPVNFGYLIRNVAMNNMDNVTAIPKGLYNEECRGNILRHGPNSGCYYFAKDPAGTVECTTLDASAHAEVDFVKIDVEGAELFVLQGAEATLRRWKPLVQLEINGLSERMYGVAGGDQVKWMDSLGYVVYERPDAANVFFWHPHTDKD